MSLPIAIANERQAALAHPMLTAAYAANLVRALFVLRANVARACAHAPQHLDWFLLPYNVAQRLDWPMSGLVWVRQPQA